MGPRIFLLSLHVAAILVGIWGGLQVFDAVTK